MPQEKTIKMTRKEMRQIAEPVIEAMNEAQKRGYTIDQVLMATMYALGSAIAQRGGILDMEAPLVAVLPPLALGYEDIRKAIVS